MPDFILSEPRRYSFLLPESPHKGYVLVTCTDFRLSHYSQIAERWGLIQAMTWAKSIQYMHSNFEMDAQEMVEHQEQCKTGLGWEAEATLSDTKQLQTYFLDFTLQNVKRDRNKVAHSQARHALNTRQPDYWGKMYLNG